MSDDSFEASAATMVRDELIDLNRHLPLPAALNQLLARIFSFRGVNLLYQSLPPDTDAHNFFDRVLEQLHASYEIIGREEPPIPREGPVLVLANHPFGGIDGLVLGSVLTRYRPDSKLIANRLLSSVPELDARMIPVDVFGGPGAWKENRNGLRQCLQLLRSGGCLGTFPSGEVTHWQPGQGLIDSHWSPHLAALARRTGAVVVPLYFDGRNSALFHLLGLVHERLRTLRLPRELMNKKKARLTLVAGDVISVERLRSFSSDEEAIAHIKFQTFLLRGRLETPGRRFFPQIAMVDRLARRRESEGAPIAAAVPPAELQHEIDALPESALLLEQGRFRCYACRRSEAPAIIREIGRLREVTFRQAHEGTGKAADLDEFDATYWHLFLWDVEAQAVAGAYRIGLSEEILPTRGQKGFYTHTLFKMRPRFLESLRPAMELGRSFIVQDYQKKYATLVLLWKGIGAFVLRRPEYRNLFGPVSIDREYQSLSKDIMVQFLSDKSMERELASFIRPRHPLKVKQLKQQEQRFLRESFDSIDEVSALVSEVEKSGKGVPILLKHYLKLNGRILAFNVDPDFNHAVDSLMVVDLTHVERRLLRHYLGKSGAERFLELHA